MGPEQVLHSEVRMHLGLMAIPQSSRTGAFLSEGFVSYPGHAVDVVMGVLRSLKPRPTGRYLFSYLFLRTPTVAEMRDNSTLK